MEKIQYFEERKEKTKLHRENLQKVETVDRFSINAMHTLQNQKEALKVKNFCETCWLINHACLCSRLKELNIQLAFANTDVEYHFWLYMHSREYGRSTNTGVLLVQTFPTNTHLVICGDLEAEALLSQQLVTNPSFVLYPSAKAISKTIRENQSSRSDGTFLKASPNDSAHVNKKRRLCLYENECLVESKVTDQPSDAKKSKTVVNVIILDAKHMSRELPPSVQHVKLSNNRPTISNMRTQSSDDRVTTIEAVAMLLEEMKMNEEMIGKLWDWIRIRLDNYQKLGGKGKIPKHKTANGDENTDENELEDESSDNEQDSKPKKSKKKKKKKQHAGNPIPKKCKNNNNTTNSNNNGSAETTHNG